MLKTPIIFAFFKIKRKEGTLVQSEVEKSSFENLLVGNTRALPPPLLLQFTISVLLGLFFPHLYQSTSPLNKSLSIIAAPAATVNQTLSTTNITVRYHTLETWITLFHLNLILPESKVLPSLPLLPTKTILGMTSSVDFCFR
ncbi:hypothetical protein LOAG_11412 [Loa loa]|uniref:Uncharacterized protein n=1 Tax=Loa loa TaxID=7209 RepID=A0A1S0TN37_LOALO|nr:hypothetical protein LOAG_11412 [Loa loa]EFO17088.1 hypothetical protein LOAG_11412 [Loa loa]